MEQGLGLLAAQTETMVCALLGAIDLAAPSNLRVWVPRPLWRKADWLRQRFSEEAIVAGREEWTTRSVLLASLAAYAARSLEEWNFQEGRGNYRFRSEAAGE